MTLNISKTVQLPLEAVTSTFGLLAVRGAGKTNAARALAEEMFAAGLPFVAIDPVGSWYGLRADKDGKAAGGLPIFIFGGDHGDVPLTRGSGDLVADIIVNDRLACIIDLSGFDSEADKKAFLLAFARRFYQKNRDPIHLFLEEADDYIPQNPMKDELQLKRAWENIVRRGRGRGIGMTLITQRSAVVNKDVLTQVETLFVMRTTGPQDIKAIEGWTKYHDFGHDLLSKLSGLEDGEAYVWSPHFLKTNKRFKFRMSTTFDSGATPKNLKGTAARKIATLRDVDVDKLKGRIEATVEKVKLENPALLRGEVARLKQQQLVDNAEIQRLHTELSKAKPPVDLKGLNALIEKLAVASEKTEGAVNKLHGMVKASPMTSGQVARVKDVPLTYAQRVPSRKPLELPAGARTDGEFKLQACPRSLLEVLVVHYPKSLKASAVSILSGYLVKSSGFQNGLSTLRVAKLIVGKSDALTATELGCSVAGEVSALPSGKDLLEYWKNKLDKCPATLLQVIYDAGVMREQAVAKKYIAEHAGYSESSSGFQNGLSTLRTLELITGYKEMKAADTFYD